MKTVAIIGGGVAGIASAKILSKYFDKVTIYDAGEAKQSLHQHVLLKAGQVILDEIFPGIMQKLREAGCLEIDWALDTIWENTNGAFPRYESSIKTLSMSRTYLQKTMQEEIGKISNVEFKNGRIKELGDLNASLAVIAGGQNFPLNRFLGISNTIDIISSIDLTYRSYIFNRDELHLEGMKQYYFQIDPPFSFIGGVICPIEDGKVMVTIIEKEKDLSKCESFYDFLGKAKLIPSQKFYEIIKDATPITNLAIFRKLNTHRKLLDKSTFPKNVIVLGEVLTSLNPVFGQGMTLSLMQVDVLDKMLNSNSFNEDLFHVKCNSIGRFPYFLSKTGSEEKSIGKKILRIYLLSCQKSQWLHRHFLKILHSLGSTHRYI